MVLVGVLLLFVTTVSGAASEINFVFDSMLRGAASNGGCAGGACSAPAPLVSSCPAGEPRRLAAFASRIALATAAANQGVPCKSPKHVYNCVSVVFAYFCLAGHVTNGDEERYANKLNSFSKGLPHGPDGLVNLT